MTRMDWLPAAIRRPHPRSFPWTETTDPKGCLHTTETKGRAGYNGWTVMPHAEVLPIPGKGVEVVQFLPFSQASFALRHTRPQATNGDYVFQFELVGTSDPGRRDGAYRWFEADDAVLLDLYKKVIRPLDQAFVIPFRAVAFGPYPSLKGSRRMTDAEFDRYTGWHGHQHVPQNDHGDPGAFPWARLAALAARYEESLEDDDMPTAAEVAKALLDQPIQSTWHGYPMTVRTMLQSMYYYTVEAGCPTNRPDGNKYPGTPTMARVVLDRLGGLGQAITELDDDLPEAPGEVPPPPAA